MIWCNKKLSKIQQAVNFQKKIVQFYLQECFENFKINEHFLQDETQPSKFAHLYNTYNAFDFEKRKSIKCKGADYNAVL